MSTALLAALSAMGVAQCLKLIIQLIKAKELKWSLLSSAGGMPSSHAALVTALSVAIALTEGIDSPAFAVSVVLGFIVIHDAHVVRYNAGRHASALNQIKHQIDPDPPIPLLKESLGHTKIEILVGILLGMAVSFIIVWIFN